MPLVCNYANKNDDKFILLKLELKTTTITQSQLRF